MNSPLNEKRLNVIVYDLDNDDKFTFVNIEPIEALINTALICNKQVSQLHNPLKRDSIRNGIEAGKYGYHYDSFSVKFS